MDLSSLARSNGDFSCSPIKEIQAGLNLVSLAGVNKTTMRGGGVKRQVGGSDICEAFGDEQFSVPSNPCRQVVSLLFLLGNPARVMGTEPLRPQVHSLGQTGRR